MSDAAAAQDEPTKTPPTGDGASSRPVVHQSADLLQGHKEAWIEHEGVRYRLRLTSAGKLYLTK